MFPSTTRNDSIELTVYTKETFKQLSRLVIKWLHLDPIIKIESETKVYCNVEKLKEKLQKVDDTKNDYKKKTEKFIFSTEPLICEAVSSVIARNKVETVDNMYEDR